MVRAVLWKEWREQAAIILALLALGTAVMAMAIQFGGNVTSSSLSDLSSSGIAARLSLVMLAMTLGTVIGGALFAGEHEAGMTHYLDFLPATRWRFWRAKMAAGILLTIIAGGILIGVGAALGAAGPFPEAGVMIFLLAVLILASFGWGACGSVLSRSTLSACGLGVIAGHLGLMLFAILSAILGGILDGIGILSESQYRRELMPMVTAFATLVTPYLLSGLIYSARDRARYAYEAGPGAVGTTQQTIKVVARRRLGWGFRALVWLCLRQYLVPGLVLAGLALFFGLIVLADPIPMVVAWPVVTLFLAALMGVVGWMDEQHRDVYKFWGERRLPVGRLWLIKVLSGLVMSLALACIFFLPTFFRAVFADEVQDFGRLTPFYSGLLATGYLNRIYGASDSPANFFFYVFTWPVFGFAAGHLAGLLFRKAVVAAGVAILAGGSLAALWFPSFFGGGLHHWQLWPAPVLLLLTARLILRAWSADHLAHRRALTRLAFGLTCVLGVTAAGLGYRAIEVPIIAEAEDDLRYAKTIPTFEENLAGRDIRTAVARFQQGARLHMSEVAEPPLFQDDPENINFSTSSQSATYGSRLYQVARNGWPTHRKDLAEWLDNVFASEWEQPLFDAMQKPLGIVEDPTSISFDSPIYAYEEFRQMTAAMLARGLQRQAEGDDEAFLRYLEAVLALSRNLSHKSLIFHAYLGRSAEALALTAVGQWLTHLDGRADLIQKALTLIQFHVANDPSDEQEHWLTSRTVIRTSVESPSTWSDRYFTNLMQEGRRKWSSDVLQMRVETESNILAFCWSVPWEKERLRRVVGLGNDPNRELEVFEYTRGAPGMFATFAPGGRINRQNAEAQRSACILMLALRKHEAERGSFPDTLEQLVDRQYLPTIPLDPYDGLPFKYRISAGETLQMEEIRMPSIPVVGPGFDESGAYLENDRLDAIAAAMSGLVRFARPLPAPPGLEPPDLLLDTEFDLYSTVASSLVQWPLPPLTEESIRLGGRFPDDRLEEDPQMIGDSRVPSGFMYYDNGPFDSSRRELVFEGWDTLDERRRLVEIPTGQPILWSVGPDGLDDGGKVLSEYRQQGGDLITIVPLRPKKPPMAIPMK